MLSAILVGIISVFQLPREEEPQISVPMIDVFVGMPGASPKEVEERVTRPLEARIREIPGVEYVYSTSSQGMSTVIVRFEVGENEGQAILRLRDKLLAHGDAIPAGASEPLIKPRSIDDVPVLSLTLSSDRYDGYELRRVAAELSTAIRAVDNVSEVTLIGGQRRQVRVLLDPERLAGRNVSPLAVANALSAHRGLLSAGAVAQANRELLVETGSVLRTAKDVGGVVVGGAGGRPVYLRDVAKIVDGGEEPANYVRFGLGAGAPDADEAGRTSQPAVTLAIAKRKGENAVDVVQGVMAKVEAVRTDLLPKDVRLSVTRDYGETANEKSNELLFHMGIAIVSVALLIWLALGRRESVIVVLAIPVTLALTLAVFYVHGYTLNRITLFALIFSIGILVDDAIVVVENITRHYRLPESRGKSLHQVAVDAVAEVGNPTILATMTVVAAILPMAFVSGLMGPYMRPIPIGATAAMMFSLLVAFIVTPWAAVRLLRKDSAAHDETEGRSTQAYRRGMGWLLAKGRRRWGFLGLVVALLLGSMALVGVGAVQVKMLPFDNKSEFQVVIDMPEGTTLEQTARVTDEIARAVGNEPEVVGYQSYVGTSGPYSFNGLVRHYFLRRGSNVADIVVQLQPKGDRPDQSHDIAKRVRTAITPLARRFGAAVKVAEIPPGPPVLQTMVIEIYGPEHEGQIEIAEKVKKEMEFVGGVVDVDWYVENPQPKIQLVVDETKAALHGVSEPEVARALSLALRGERSALLRDPREREDVPVVVGLDRPTRSDLSRLKGLGVAAGDGSIVSLRELVKEQRTEHERSIYRKNLKRVVYVTADLAGEIESPVYAVSVLGPKFDQLNVNGYSMEQHTAEQPSDTSRYGMKWDGEWHITYEVFRDLGLAFAVVLLLIYVLVVAWFQSFSTPLVIMSAIPFSLVGILPAHAAMGAFFTATSMIGFIAGAGIVVRNSIILVDFIELRLKQGVPLREAVVDAGAVRFRPMLLTAAAVVVGATVILFDPIFQGLAISLMAGEVASLLLSRVTVPVAYYILQKRRQGRESKQTSAVASPEPAPA